METAVHWRRDEGNVRTNFFHSSLAKKYVMAITGFALLIFVIGHMLGNLQVFLGPNQINAYGNFLQTTPELLWSARIGLVVMVLLHIYSAIKLSAENKAARPIPYGAYNPVAASYASRTMLMSGLIILAFVIYHLLHYTVQVKAVNLTGQDFIPLHDEKGRHDIYRMMIIGFSNVWVSIFYLIGVGLLSLHLSHGTSSMFQSLGWKTEPIGHWIDRAARIGAVVLFLGYASIPLAVLTGLLK
jgi:succinate dehydrogenase / fumarate reductase cytochrome b subunit